MDSIPSQPRCLALRFPLTATLLARSTRRPPTPQAEATLSAVAARPTATPLLGVIWSHPGYWLRWAGAEGGRRWTAVHPGTVLFTATDAFDLAQRVHSNHAAFCRARPVPGQPSAPETARCAWSPRGHIHRPARSSGGRVRGPVSPVLADIPYLPGLLAALIAAACSLAASCPAWRAATSFLVGGFRWFTL